MVKNKSLAFVVSGLLLVTVYSTAAQDPAPTTDDELGLESKEFQDQPFDMDEKPFNEDEIIENTEDSTTVDMDEKLFNEDEIIENTEDSTTVDFFNSLRQHPFLAPAHFTFSYELAYGIEDPKNLVINRPSLRLQWEKGKGNYFVRFDGKVDKDFVYNSSDYNDEVKDKYSHQSEIREFYLQGSKGAFSAKLGRQLVIWGKADGGIVTDIMSPRDLTELVFTSVEYSRIGQNMFVADAYHQNSKTKAQHQWSLIIIPDIKVNDIASPGHPYGIDIQLASLFPSSTPNQMPPVFVDERPEASWTKPEIGLRWGVTSGKVDWSMMAAEVHENNPVFILEETQDQDTIRAQYPRYQMLGMGFNRGHGSFVWKGELAYKNNRQFNLSNELNTERYQVFDLAFGFDFNANGAYTMSLELSNQHIVDWDSRLLNTRRNETVVYAIWNKTWLNETLTTQYTGSAQLQDSESFHRFEIQHDINDQWSAEIQVDYFDARLPDSLFGQLQDKHRVSVQVNFDY